MSLELVLRLSVHKQISNVNMIVPESLIFCMAILDTGALLFLLIYYEIVFSDLECDYLNAQECCSKLNLWVSTKLFAHIFLTLLLLLNGSWILVICNLPMTIWLLYDILKVPQGNIGLYDPTEIHNRGQLSKYMRNCLICIVFYLIFFFVYLYCLMISLLKGNPINRQEELMDNTSSEFWNERMYSELYVFSHYNNVISLKESNWNEVHLYTCTKLIWSSSNQPWRSTSCGLCLKISQWCKWIP